MSDCLSIPMRACVSGAPGHPDQRAREMLIDSLPVIASEARQSSASINQAVPHRRVAARHATAIESVRP
jgi:hypothetical protein